MPRGAESAQPDRYWLAGHVWMALYGPHAVLMDERRNRYLAVQPADCLCGWVEGWPAPEPFSGVRSSAPPAALGRLLEQGMVVREARAGHAARPLATVVPQRTLLEFDFDRPPRPRGRDWYRMARAWSTARVLLGLRPMRAVLERVRALGTEAGRADSSFDMERARTLVHRFVHLRPWFYSVPGACLLDSLVLRLFLAAYDLHPHWVFGVRTAPFHAHCWVQHDGVVLNDLPDRVRQYSPILRI